MIKRETERLVLRNFTPDDWEAMLELSQQYEQTDMAQYDQQFPQTVEGMKEAVVWLSSGDSFAAVVLKSNQKMIGLVQFQRKEKFTSEVVHGFGYIFNSDYHGKGYATEACRNVLVYLFDELKIDKCIAGTAAVNTSSRKLLERLGFKKVNQKTAHFREDSDGNPIEFQTTEYALTAADWKAVNNQ
ncbi:MAG: GNAT family N-acetyltransferase [Candidatus Heimdallarchaeota archaeon]|nr:GNAT family N-acetyltransferase [Candidatus Heimdallarchaeota archaeon]MBY8995196.1 GNAT family N-acetyltransferase [Candidatus Heimdallarchaeota archaeon]